MRWFVPERSDKELAMSHEVRSRAEAGLKALHQRLAKENPAFADASAQEMRIDAFCAAVRQMLQNNRKEQSLQQEEIAERMDLTQSAVSKIENGHGDIGLRTLHRYASALGLRPVLSFVPDRKTPAETKAAAVTSAARRQAARG